MNTPRRPLRVLAATAVAGGLALAATACGATHDSTASGEAVRDPSYLFERVQAIRASPVLDNALEPENLEAAMPNHEFRVETDIKTVRFSFSDAVVSGNITNVAEGDGYVYVDGDEARLVPFDSPEAQAQDLLVTMTVDEATGADAQTVQFRLGVLAGSDPEELMASIRGLGEVVVVLEKIETGAHTGEFIPVMSGALIGEVSASGAAKFPALGSTASSFVGDLGTVDEIFEEAAGDPPVETLG